MWYVALKNTAPYFSGDLKSAPMHCSFVCVILFLIFLEHLTEFHVKSLEIRVGDLSAAEGGLTCNPICAYQKHALKNDYAHTYISCSNVTTGLLFCFQDVQSSQSF